MLENLSGIFSIVLIFAGLFAVGTLLNYIRTTLVSNTEFNVNNEYKLLSPEIDIDELSDNEDILVCDEPTTGDFEASVSMLLVDNGSTIRDKNNQFEFDPDNEVDVLKRSSGLKSLIFKKNEVFEFDDYKFDKKIGEFSDPALDMIRLVLPLNEKYILVAGDRAGSPYPDTYLWQVETKTLKQQQITDKVYFIHSRPPKIFVSDRSIDSGENREIVVVYYKGEEHFFSYGGGATKPKFSVIRIYNSQYPDGNDLAEFNYKAGTIVEVKWKNDELILVGDPSPPRMASNKPRLPVRIWSLKKASDNII